MACSYESWMLLLPATSKIETTTDTATTTDEGGESYTVSVGINEDTADE